MNELEFIQEQAINALHSGGVVVFIKPECRISWWCDEYFLYSEVVFASGNKKPYTYQLDSIEKNGRMYHAIMFDIRISVLYKSGTIEITPGILDRR